MLHGAVIFTGIGYFLVGMSVYLAFPDKIKSNVLNSFDPRQPLMQFARGVVGLLQIASYPVNHFPARMAVRDIVGKITGKEPSGAGFIYTESIVFFMATLAISLFVTDLGAVFEVIGGSCGSIIILGMPALLILYNAVRTYHVGRLRYPESSSLIALCTWEFLAGGSLMFLSIILLFYTLYNI